MRANLRVLVHQEAEQVPAIDKMFLREMSLGMAGPF
jgi:hypothetical protein